MTFSLLTPTIRALGETPASSWASPSSLLSTTIFLVCAESAQAQIASNEAKRRMEAFLLWEMRILPQVGPGFSQRRIGGIESCRQIFRARRLSISEWRGTVALAPVAGLPQVKCRPHSRCI